MQSPVSLTDIFDIDTIETIEESPVSYVARARYKGIGGESLVAIKTASYLPEYSKEPHDIVKELRLLSTLSHSNIIDVLGNTYEQSTQCIHFWMPYVTYSLCDLLSSPTFSPHEPPVISNNIHRLTDFVTLTRSLIYQIASALSYLHDDCGIAHRDIKPRNILLTNEGCVKLIDLGIAWDKTFSPTSDVFWPEPPDRLCSHVCSGPYRAPETIFSAKDYDPYALDAWSLGATLAEFYTPLHFTSDDDIESSYSDEESLPDDTQSERSSCLPPFVNPPAIASQRGTWSRDSLFDAERGSIGLAWSIFRTRGTPNDHNWPKFKSLTEASTLTFLDAKPFALHKLLPNLPDGTRQANVDIFDEVAEDDEIDHFPPPAPEDSALDFVHRFLVYPSERRLKPREALNHPWLTRGAILLPANYPSLDLAAQQSSSQQVASMFSYAHDSEGKILRDMLLSFVSDANGR